MSINDAEAVNRTDVRPWQDAETLRWAYDKVGQSCSPVADLLGCGRRTVNRWMERHDLYPAEPAWHNEETLRELYNERGLSQHEIADRFDCTQMAVANQLNRFEITDHECPTCGGMFPSYTGVKIHHKNVHDVSIAGETVECSWCGDEFTRRRHATGGRRFCGYPCYGQWRSEEYTGENHHGWVGGVRRDYGPGWNEEKREAVRERDGRQCVDCGMSGEHHRTRFGCRLHVHHIRPARDFDDPHERNDEDNLVTLCCECHLGKWEQLPYLRPDTR